MRKYNLLNFSNQNNFNSFLFINDLIMSILKSIFFQIQSIKNQFSSFTKTWPLSNLHILLMIV